MRSSIVAALACAVSLAVLPAHATDQPDELMPGRVVTIRDGQTFRLVARPPAGTTFELPDPTNDPTAAGGTLLVFDDDPSRPVTSEANLPSSHWKALGNPPGSFGYKYSVPGLGDPCKLVLVRKNVVKAVCAATFYLPTPFTGQVGVVLTLGPNSKRYCALFGGTELRNDSTLLKRKDAPSPGACPLDINSSTTSSTTSTVTSTTGPSGLYCCDGAPGCLGGFSWDMCLHMGYTPVAGAVCDASFDCVPPPGTPGYCCDSFPPPLPPTWCAAMNAAVCANEGGTYHPASVCEPSGFCNP